VPATGGTVREVLAALDRAHPGMRFRMIDEQDRIRPHIRIFVGHDEVRHIDATLRAGDEVHLVCALSGG
jgi:molybdopterin converting factor small subunit